MATTPMTSAVLRLLLAVLLFGSSASIALGEAVAAAWNPVSSADLPVALAATAGAVQSGDQHVAAPPAPPVPPQGGPPRVEAAESPTPPPSRTPGPLPTTNPTTKPALPTPTRVAASGTPQPTATPTAQPTKPAPIAAGGKPPRFVPPSDITYKSLGYGDTTVNGVYGSLDVYVPGAGGYPMADGGYLKTVFSHAGILLGDRSTMIVRLNDVPLVTIRLGSENTNRTELKVSLPKDKLTNTVNHIKYEFYMRIAEGVCTDELNNPALNTTIYGESTVHYEYASLVRKEPATPPTLADYPAPFVYAGYTWPDELFFVLPDDASTEELTAASSIAAKLGQLAKGKIVTPTLTTASLLDQTTRQDYNLVYVGKAQSLELPPELRQKASLEITTDGEAAPLLRLGGTQLAVDSGAIRLVNSPWNPRQWVLIVTGATDQAVRRAGTALSTKTYLQTLKGDQAVITQEPRPSALLANDDPGLPKEASLNQMGVSDILVTGLGELKGSSIPFSSLAPSTKDDAYIDVVLSHSPLLVTSESSLRVEVNGLSIRSLQLDDSNVQPTTVRVEIPPRILKPGANSLSFRVTLFGQSVETCGPVDRSRAWAVIHGQSTLHVPPSGPEPPLSLDRFPYPFLGTGPRLESAYLERNALILPDEPREWRDFLLLSMALGSYSTADVLTLPSMTARNRSDTALAEKNVILYGTWGANAMLEEAGAALPLQLVNEQGKTFSLPTQETVSVSDAEPTGIVETVTSPWNRKKALLIVSGTTVETLPWASSALAGGRARGNLSTITKREEISTFTLVTTVLLPRPAGLGLSIPVTGTIGVGVLIFGCVISIALEPLFRRSRKTRESDQGPGGPEAP